MLKVKSKVKINTARIKQLNQAAITSLEQTAEALHTEIVQAEVMPRDEGTLQNESTFVNYSKSNQGQVSIVSSTPYARRLYYHPEYHFSREKNIAAGGKWFEDWLPGGQNENFCKEEFEKNYRRNGGF